jgi:phosphohistidine phosphatase SixA
MTTAAIGWPSTRTVGRLGSWLSVQHSLRTEAAAALALYGLYELARGLVDADRAEADAHAHRLVALERSLHLFVESNVQRAVQTLPGLTSLLGVAYLTLHLAVTAGVLVWLHRRRP